MRCLHRGSVYFILSSVPCFVLLRSTDEREIHLFHIASWLQNSPVTVQSPVQWRKPLFSFRVLGNLWQWNQSALSCVFLSHTHQISTSWALSLFLYLFRKHWFLASWLGLRISLLDKIERRHAIHYSKDGCLSSAWVPAGFWVCCHCGKELCFFLPLSLRDQSSSSPLHLPHVGL